MRAYQFKMYPTSTETALLFYNLNSARHLYNKLLEVMKDKKVSKKELSKFLTEYKKTEEGAYLNNCYSKMLQPIVDKIFASISGLSSSKKNGNKVGRLRFKSRNRLTSFTYNQSGFKIIETDKRYNKLHLSKIGDIRFKQNRDIEGNIKQVQIKLKPSGWYCYIITDGKYECKNRDANEIGVDLGVINFLVTSDKQFVENPQYLNKLLHKIKSIQRQISQKKKGSSNRRKLIQKLLRVFEKIDNQKKDFFHKLSTELVKNNSLICLEDLDIKNMTDKSKRNNKYHNMRNILGSSWATFINMLKIKVSSTKSEIVFVNPRNTSKKCSHCGNLQDMPLSKRQYVCDCGLNIDRDYNSAINILKTGKELTFVGEDTITSSMNQESMSFRA